MKRRQLCAMFVDQSGKISIGHVEQSPRQLAGLARSWTRTAVDCKRVRGFGASLSVFEETQQQPLANLVVAYASDTLATAISEARRTLCV